MKNYKTLVTLCISILFSNLAMYSQTEPLDTDGNGYRNISTLDELRWVSENPESWTWNFELDNDIDASDTKNWNNGLGFSPIGTTFSSSFSGEFEGHGYIIQNLYINRPSQINVGLFGYIVGGEIRNVGVVNCDISGNNYVGGLVGVNMAPYIFKCFSIGSVVGIDYVGGLVGYNHVSRVRNNYSRASVQGNDYVGGLVGYHNQSSSLNNSYSAGSVLGNDNVSGLLGYNHFSETSFCFWDTETSGIEDLRNGIGIGKSTAEMKSLSTFTDADWDFENIWDIDGITNDGYPFFREIPASIFEIKNIVDNNSLVYPNPSSNTITISAIESGMEYKILNTFGVEVMKGIYLEVIDISNLTPGLYFIQIVDNGITLKFVKQ